MGASISNTISDNIPMSVDIDKQFNDYIYNGNIEAVKKMLHDRPYLLHYSYKYNDTPLHLACYYDQVDIIKYLLEQGANVHYQNCFGDTPYVGCKSDQARQILVANGAVEQEFEDLYIS